MAGLSYRVSRYHTKHDETLLLCGPRPKHTQRSSTAGHIVDMNCLTQCDVTDMQRYAY